jgi:hypothetical protein
MPEQWLRKLRKDDEGTDQLSLSYAPLFLVATIVIAEPNGYNTFLFRTFPPPSAISCLDLAASITPQAGK